MFKAHITQRTLSFSFRPWCRPVAFTFSAKFVQVWFMSHSRGVHGPHICIDLIDNHHSLLMPAFTALFSAIGWKPKKLCCVYPGFCSWHIYIWYIHDICIVLLNRVETLCRNGISSSCAPMCSYFWQIKTTWRVKMWDIISVCAMWDKDLVTLAFREGGYLWGAQAVSQQMHDLE